MAAAELIGERGYDATSLEAVAARAGMSRGAIYGNFADRDALFMAVAETFARPFGPDAGAEGSVREKVLRLGKAVAEQAPERRRVALGTVSFFLYALRNPELRKRLRAGNERLYREAAQRLRDDLAKDGMSEEDLGVAALDFVKVAHLLAEGALLMHALTPQLVTQEVMASAFELLSRSIPEPVSPPRSSRRRARP